MSNIITLRTPFKIKEYHFTPLPEKNGLRKPFVKPVEVDASGDTHMILSEAERNDPESKYFLPEDMDIVITEGTTFNLDDPLDRNKWEAIKDSDLIVPTRDARDENGVLLIDGNKQRYGIAEIFVDVAGEESLRSVNRKRLILEAQTFVFGDSPNGILTKCRLLGRNMRNAPLTDAQDYLLQLADRSPQKVIDLYTGQDTGLQLLFLDAREKNIIIKQNGWFMYGETNLGATEDAVISFFKTGSNKSILDALKKHVYPEFAAQFDKPVITDAPRPTGPKSKKSTEEV